MRILRLTLIALVALALLTAGAIAIAASALRDRLEGYEEALIDAAPEPSLAADAIAELPAPVQRYVAFAFPEGLPEGVRWAAIEMAGAFRRPLTEGFEPTTARQVAAAATPDFVFSADTPVLGPLWAIAYDVYLGGSMEMEARLLSAVTVMRETSTPALDRSSLRRWLLESPTFPMALLPGGPVVWEPIDERHARAIVRAHGAEASLVAVFAEDGRLERFEAEAEGDLTTPYHGSGEWAARGDYRPVEGVMVPMRFEIARLGDGGRHPFWRGEITSIEFGR